MEKECVFCQIVSGQIPSHKVYEDDSFLAFLDIDPISLGHTLIIPKTHSTTLLEANQKVRAGMIEMVARLAPGILKAVGAPAFNVGINTGKEAGQIIFHTHVHVIPRFPQDGLRSWGRAANLSPNLPDIAQKIRRALESK
ncbi:MAG: HIT family protein [Candidatus Diapherotrites archaeon]|nr:HIT family protein [Candidatus Diapherotrites archaeon]MDZ4256651.1 HIT family protein [archaeon]